MSWILLTNDDGIDAISLQSLVDRLHERGHKIIVFAPMENMSAVSMKLSLGIPLALEQRKDERENIHQFALGGSPCDCIITALDGGLKRLLPGIIPKLVVSGINLGPNLSQDSYHSGTMAAAREAGLYGMPAIAASWSSFEPEGMEVSIDATVELVEIALKHLPELPPNLNRPNIDLEATHISRWPEVPLHPAWENNPIQALQTAFSHGEMILNLNVPPNWNRKFATTRLGMRWYRNAVSFSEDKATFTIGGSEIVHDTVYRGDADADAKGFASVSCLASWPQSHPLALDDGLLTWTLLQSPDGLPVWLHS